MTNHIPASGYVRLPAIIGQAEITQEQAARNRERGRGPRRPRPGRHGVLPMSASTWWAGIRAGKYPSGVKLSPKITAWKAEDIRRLLEAAE